MVIFNKALVYLPVVAALLLSGCASIDAAFDKGADIQDELVNGSVEGLCNRYSVGAIKRRFNTQEKAEVWKKLCGFEL